MAAKKDEDTPKGSTPLPTQASPADAGGKGTARNSIALEPPPMTSYRSQSYITQSLADVEDEWTKCSLESILFC